MNETELLRSDERRAVICSSAARALDHRLLARLELLCIFCDFIMHHLTVIHFFGITVIITVIICMFFSSYFLYYDFSNHPSM